MSKSLDEKPNEHEYQIKVFTGDEHGAGTDSNVFVELNGKKASSGPVPLKKSTTHKNKFERNQTDIFIVRLPDLGQLQRLTVWHDNHGPGPDWFLDKIIVDCPTLGRKYLFPCGRWLAKNREDRSLRRELVPKPI